MNDFNKTKRQISTHVVNNGKGSVNFTNYLESPETDPYADRDLRDTDEEEDLSPLPCQEYNHSDNYTSSDSDASSTKVSNHKLATEATFETTKRKVSTELHRSPTTYKPYVIPASLRQPFKDPRQKKASIITPQTKFKANSSTIMRKKSKQATCFLALDFAMLI
jgi:hypothetical protein